MRRFLALPHLEDEQKAQRAKILNVLLLVAPLVAIVVIIASILLPRLNNPQNPAPDWANLGGGFSLLLFSFGLKYLLNRGYVQLSGILFTTLLFVQVAINRTLHGGLRDSGLVGLMLIVVIATFVLGFRGTVLFSLLVLGVAYAMYSIQRTSDLTAQSADPIQFGEWFTFALLIFIGSVLLTMIDKVLRDTSARLRLSAETAQANEQTLLAANKELGNTQSMLADRTIALERRTRYLEAAATVAASATTYLDPGALLDQVAHLISEEFGFYHTGIFLIDEARENAVMVAASSPGGQKMIARGHRLTVGKQGIVGYVTSIGRAHIAQATEEDRIHRQTSELPETRSEMALPLRARGEIIGAIDIQDKIENAFTEDDVTILQVLADQVALAISNARLFQQARESTEEARRAFGQLRREQWSSRAGAQNAYLYNRGRIEAATSIEDDPADPESIQLPIIVRDSVIGKINIRRPGKAELTPEEQELIDTLSAQLALAMESAQLFQRSQQLAFDERMVTDVSARIRETLDIDSILMTATQEIKQAMNLPEVTIRLSSESLSILHDETDGGNGNA